MSYTLKPGEYVGADGDLYRYRVGDRGIFREQVTPGTSYPPHLPFDDLRAAGLALVSLADELETERVPLDFKWGDDLELVRHSGKPPQLATVYGDKRCTFDRDIKPVVSYGSIADIADAAYRAGLERVAK